MRKAADPIVSLRNDPALLAEDHFANTDRSVLSRTKDAFGQKCKERRIKQGHLVWLRRGKVESMGVKDESGYKPDAKGNATELHIVRLIHCWSIAHLHEAIAEGQVLNVEELRGQIEDMADDEVLLAHNHVEYVRAEEIITGITESELDKVCYFHRNLFLNIVTPEGADLSDEQQPREYWVVERENIPWN
ncbi:hypothetical protein PENSPDRAFT_693319 [Peniophora sp. CONT]|nr:hypothetical protein PENSPDRAFT_693319 [Peniophora sp. CONT]